MESFEPVVGFAVMAIDPIEEGGEINQLVSRIHKVEVEYVFLAGHAVKINPKIKIPNSNFSFQIENLG